MADIKGYFRVWSEVPTRLGYPLIRAVCFLSDSILFLNYGLNTTIEGKLTILPKEKLLTLGNHNWELKRSDIHYIEIKQSPNQLIQANSKSLRGYLSLARKEKNNKIVKREYWLYPDEDFWECTNMLSSWLSGKLSGTPHHASLFRLTEMSVADQLKAGISRDEMITRLRKNEGLDLTHSEKMVDQAQEIVKATSINTQNRYLEAIVWGVVSVLGGFAFALCPFLKRGPGTPYFFITIGALFVLVGSIRRSKLADDSEERNKWLFGGIIASVALAILGIIIISASF